MLGERQEFLPQLTLQSVYHYACELQQQESRKVQSYLAAALHCCRLFQRSILKTWAFKLPVTVEQKPAGCSRMADAGRHHNSEVLELVSRKG